MTRLAGVAACWATIVWLVGLTQETWTALTMCPLEPIDDPVGSKP